MAWWVFLALLWTGPMVPASAQAQQPVPKLQARVNDLTGTLSQVQAAALESRLAQIEARHGAQVAVLLVQTTGEEAIEQYALRVAETWKIGRGRASDRPGAAAPPDDGVLIVVALSDRRMRIEVGYGLEGAIPDALAKRIISERMAPRFREGEIAAGLMAAVDALAERIAGASLSPPASREGDPARRTAPSAAQPAPLGDVLPVLLVAGMVGLVVSQFLGRLPGALVGAGLGGLGGASLLGTWLWAVPLAFGVFVLVLMMGGVRAGGRGMRSAGGHRGSTPWGVPGGGGWGSGSGGASGGGFSGGGGGFGGGGASGDW